MEKNPGKHLGWKRNLVNTGIHYQPQLVSLPDFWTINSMFIDFSECKSLVYSLNDLPTTPESLAGPNGAASVWVNTWNTWKWKWRFRGKMNSMQSKDLQDDVLKRNLFYTIYIYIYVDIDTYISMCIYTILGNTVISKKTRNLCMLQSPLDPKLANKKLGSKVGSRVDGLPSVKQVVLVKSLMWCWSISTHTYVINPPKCQTFWGLVVVESKLGLGKGDYIYNIYIYIIKYVYIYRYLHFSFIDYPCAVLFNTSLCL